MSISNLMRDNSYDLKSKSLNCSSSLHTNDLVSNNLILRQNVIVGGVTNGDGDSIITVPSWDSQAHEAVIMCNYVGNVQHTRPLTTHNEDPSAGTFVVSGDASATFHCIVFFKLLN